MSDASRVAIVTGAVGGIGRGLDGQIELLQPGVGNHRSGRLIFIRADIDAAARDAGIAVEIGCVRNVRIIPDIDAR